MFNFFKRSKKENDGSSGRNRKTKDKDCKEASASPTQTRTEMCKNNQHFEDTEITLQGENITYPAPAPNKIENLASVAIPSNDAGLLNEDRLNRTNKINEEADVEFPQMSFPVQNSVPISNANMLKRPEQKPTRMVKPCGHGTLAIAPRVPISPFRRNSSSTPPGSPDVSIKLNKRKEISDSADNISDSEYKSLPPSPNNSPEKTVCGRKLNDHSETTSPKEVLTKLTVTEDTDSSRYVKRHCF